VPPPGWILNLNCRTGTGSSCGDFDKSISGFPVF
jgi:hypothetical protein